MEVKDAGGASPNPAMEKFIISGECNDFRFVSCTMQGRQEVQEDVVDCQMKIRNNVSMFAIYDGHGGSEVAHFCKENFPAYIRGNWRPSDIPRSLQNAFVLLDHDLKSSYAEEELETLCETYDQARYSNALSKVLHLGERPERPKKRKRLSEDCGPCSSAKEVVEIIDDDMMVICQPGSSVAAARKSSSSGGSQTDSSDSDTTIQDSKSGYACGSTAIITVITDNHIYVANAGDSKCWLSRGGKICYLSVEHTPFSASEMQRVALANGYLEDGKLAGEIEVTRCLGDHRFKRSGLPEIHQALSSVPDVADEPLDPSTDNFIFMASRGVWECMTSQGIHDFISERLTHRSLSEIAVELIDNIIASTQIEEATSIGQSNMSCIIIELFPHVDKVIIKPVPAKPRLKPSITSARKSCSTPKKDDA